MPAANARDLAAPETGDTRAAGDIGPAWFDGRMAALGPFEEIPHIAVAVSGGADSRALVLLAREWVVARPGARLTALTVDHGLRPDSADEAARTGAWLRDHRIAHVILRWTGPKPASGVQAAARAARYGLMEGWCRREGVLHLLVAHQRDDQAETALLRRERGTGPRGRAAMPAISETPDLRLLRPLLPIPGTALRAWLAARGESWIEDPSNRDRRFTRVRLRAILRASPARADRLYAATIAAGAARAESDRGMARFFAANGYLSPLGFAVLSRDGVRRLSGETLETVLSRLVQAVSGSAFPPRRQRVRSLGKDLLATGLGHARTLGGCRLMTAQRAATGLKARADGDLLLVVREPGAVAPELDLVVPSRPETAGDPHWDGRFVVMLAGGGGAGMQVGALGAEGWRQVRQMLSGRAPDGPGRLTAFAREVPAPARAALPVIRRDGRIVSMAGLVLDGGDFARFRFRPRVPLVGAPFSSA